MKSRIGALLAAAGLAAALAGCGEDAGAATAPTDQPASNATTVSDYSQDQLDEAFLKVFHERHPDASPEADQQALRTRGSMCEVFKAEGDDAYLTVLKSLTDSGMDAGDAGGFISTGVRTGCPQFLSQVP